MNELCPKCGTIEGTSTYPALDVAVCPSHGEALYVHVASDPNSAGHGHHRECLRCLVAELYGFRDGVRRGPAPAEGASP